MTDTDLIERLEKATEGDQDALLLEACRYAEQRGWITESQWWRAAALCQAGGFIDAALILVPEGWRWEVRGYCPSRAGVYQLTLQRIEDGATPALALCNAALRARQSETPDLQEGE